MYLTNAVEVDVDKKYGIRPDQKFFDQGRDSWVYDCRGRNKRWAIHSYRNHIDHSRLACYRELTTHVGNLFTGGNFHDFNLFIVPILETGKAKSSNQRIAGRLFSAKEFVEGNNLENSPLFIDSYEWCDALHELTSIFRVAVGNTAIDLEPSNVKVLGGRIVITDLCSCLENLKL